MYLGPASHETQCWDTLFHEKECPGSSLGGSQIKRHERTRLGKGSEVETFGHRSFFALVHEAVHRQRFCWTRAAREAKMARKTNCLTERARQTSILLKKNFIVLVRRKPIFSSSFFSFLSVSAHLYSPYFYRKNLVS